MNKKLTVGKLLGIIFCVLAAVGTVVLLFVNAYFGGQMKVIDKFFTALERDDINSFKSCFAEDIRNDITEEHFSIFKNTISKNTISTLQDDEKIHTKVEFVDRLKIENNSYSVKFDLTVYNDEEHKEFDSQLMPLKREGGKWVIDLSKF